ncbi:MAG TPA: PTS sugar transporter subunit IIA [Spirochaetota bacterium]|nr:PTS sugar transporter subunit IIA [Spirochaetota bacterium]HOD15570.1 PTS sugar transporter subunit IIA [Spirochaetota bacterium]HPG49137.1 PTS sugar transporter subunit IIA [Spirochaetota bacterium]HPN14024.1 PTS sugar transporter subunit IIA [Spirochaetota bacterium]
MATVTEYTQAEYIKVLEATNKYKAIEELALVFKDSEVCGDIQSLVKALKEREEIMSTGIGFGIAIPHAKIGSINEMAFAIGISRAGIDFDSMDGEPVHLVILVAAGEKQHKEYLRLLSNIMAILKKERVKDSIINSQSNEDVITILKANSL